MKDYEVDLKLKEDIEFFYRPSIVPIHLKERTTERLREYIRLGLFTMVPYGTPVKYSSSLLVVEESTKTKNMWRL